MITSNTMFVGSDVTFKVVFSTDTVAVTTGVSFLVSHKNAFTGKNYRQALNGTYSSEEGKWIIPFPASVQKDYGKYSLQCTIADWPMSGATQRVTFDNAVELTAGGAVQTIDLGTHTLQASDSEEVVVSSGFVRYDQAQTITPAGRLQACENIGAHRVTAGTGISITQPNEASGIIQIISLDAGAVVDTSSVQDIGGVKNFTSSPKVPTPTTDAQAASKKYVDEHHDDTKQAVISDLATIRSGAASGATAVQPETGKGLFSGNYNDLANKPTIPAAQVQSDWDATEGMGVILNKPTIPAAQIQSDWNQSDTSALDYIKNKPDIPAMQAQSDWTQTDTSARDYIKNKPDNLLTTDGAQNVSGAKTFTALPTVPETPSAGGHASSKKYVDSQVSAKYTKPDTGIPSSDLASAVQTSLDKADSAYQKPATGIPSSDLATVVQTSLGKADTALQSHQSLDAYRTSAAQDTIDNGKASADALTTHTSDTGIHVGNGEKATWNAKYDKPSGGIPSSDMASAVQTSLGKADTSVQPGASTTFTGTNTFQGSTAFTGKVSVPTPSGTAQEQASQAFNLGYWQGTILPTIPTLTGTNSWSGTNAFSGPTVFTGTGANRTKISYIDVNGGTSHAATGGMLYNVSCNTPTQSTHVVNKTYVDSTSTLTSAQLTYVQGSSPAEWRVDLPAERLLTECHVKVYIPDVGEVMGQQSYWANLAIIELIEGGESIEGPLYQFNFGTTTSQRTLAPDDTDTLYMHVHSYQSGSGLEAYEMSNAQYLFKNYDSSAESSTLTVTYDLGSLLRNQLRVRFRTNNTTLCNPDPESSTPFDPPRIFYRYHSL